MSANGNISSMQKPNSRFATSIIPQQSFKQKIWEIMFANSISHKKF